MLARIQQAQALGSRRVITDISAGVRMIELQRDREKILSWVQETSWLLDGLKNSGLDGLDFLYTGRVLDAVMAKAKREEMSEMRNVAKKALLSAHSPAAGAAIYFSKYHEPMKEYCLNISSQLEFFTIAPTPYVESSVSTDTDNESHKPYLN